MFAYKESFFILFLNAMLASCGSFSSIRFSAPQQVSLTQRICTEQGGPTMASLRFATAADATALLDIYAYYVLNTAVSFEIEPPSILEFRARMCAVERQFPFLLAQLDGEIVGYAYATAFKPRPAYFPAVETTIYLRHSMCQRGIGAFLYKALLDLLRLQGYYTAIAGITQPNMASEALHRKMGFQLIGVQRNIGFKMMKWHDVGQWQAELLSPAPIAIPARAFPDVARERREAVHGITRTSTQSQSKL